MAAPVTISVRRRWSLAVVGVLVLVAVVFLAGSVVAAGLRAGPVHLGPAAATAPVYSCERSPSDVGVP